MELIYIILILVIVFYIYDQYQKKIPVQTKESPEIIGEVQADQNLSLPDKIMKVGKELPYPKISWETQESESKPGVFTNVLPVILNFKSSLLSFHLLLLITVNSSKLSVKKSMLSCISISKSKYKQSPT